MLKEGRIPLLGPEHDALERVISQFGNPVGFTRRDPGETGPVIVEMPNGKLFEISDNGEIRQAS